MESSSNVYVAGETGSTNFPTQNASDPTCGTDGVCNFDGEDYYTDGFVTKMSSSGDALAYSTYLGGSRADGAGGGIALDTARCAYVTGNTFSIDFPTQSPLQGGCGGCPAQTDAFVAKMSTGGSSLAYSTYLGGSASEEGADIAVDASGNAHVAGETNSGDFPTQNPIQGSMGGSSDAFVAKILPIVLIFSDGFESGDWSRWSAVVP